MEEREKHFERLTLIPLYFCGIVCVCVCVRVCVRVFVIVFDVWLNSFFSSFAYSGFVLHLNTAFIKRADVCCYLIAPTALLRRRQCKSLKIIRGEYFTRKIKMAIFFSVCHQCEVCVAELFRESKKFQAVVFNA